MRLMQNLSNMRETTYHLTKRGFQLTTLLLAIGCCFIVKGDLFTADIFRQFSSISLLFTAIATPYIELRSD